MKCVVFKNEPMKVIIMLNITIFNRLESQGIFEHFTIYLVLQY